MLFHVKLIFNQYAPQEMSVLEDDFDHVIIDENKEMVMLYQNFIREDGQRCIEVNSIPMTAIDTMEVKPCV